MTVQKRCERCERSFESPAWAKRRFCSPRCASASNSSFGDLTGSRNNRYNGGLCIHKGRAMVCCRDGTTLWYSRALMAAHIGRLLRSDELVHHINGNGSDDRLENLQIVSRAEHVGIHRAELNALRRQATQRRIEQALDLRRQGLLNPEIAKRMNTPRGSVAALLRRRTVSKYGLAYVPSPWGTKS